ncbi:MAG: PD40 domain-containing protein [Pirellulales bacterium]|nr:PD40 domain-containing protein [Pirellulales bacterium]
MKALGIAAFLLVSLGVSAPAAETRPENLARKAKVSASLEYSDRYAPRFAVDGDIPECDARDDIGRAWCVPGKASGGKADFTLQWSEPVQIAELVYFGRTGWSAHECWKDYEVYLDGGTTPAAQGAFEMIHGPQRVKLPKTAVKQVTLKFLSSYGGANPGASEIMAFSTSPPGGYFAEFDPADVECPDWMPKADGMLVIQRHELNPSHVYTYHVEGFRPGGGLYRFTPGPGGGELKELVASPGGQILDCDLSYDGREVLFSWKQGGREYGAQFDRSLPPDTDPGHMYRIYRMNVDGTGLTPLTDGTSNNMNPCWLPDGDIAFLSDRKPAFAYCFVSTSPTLYRMDRNGGNVKRLSANYLNDFTPHVTHDGRILYSRWEYVDRPAIPIQGLWSINPDGTGLSAVFGNRVLSPATFMEARPVPGSNKLLCVLTSHNGPCRGAIGIIDRNFGPNAQQAIRNLTPEVNTGTVDQGDGNQIRGPYENPFPIDDEYFFVSKRGSIMVRNYDGTRQAFLLRPRDGLGFYSPTPILARKVPPVIAPSPLAPQPEPRATVCLQDVYQGLEPYVERGEVREICAVQEIEKSRWAPQAFIAPREGNIAAFGFQFPLVSCGATYSPKKVWGYAKVEPDGSANFKVPAELPIYFMALDAEGRAVQRMRSFTHLMPGEVQGCTGCHANRNTSTTRTARMPMAFDREPQELDPPEWGVRGFSYPAIVQPVLDKYCVECHNARQMAGDVDLSGDKTDFFNVSYDILARKGTLGERDYARHGSHGGLMGASPYTSWISTYNGEEANILKVTPKTWGSPASRLAEIVLSGHPDKDGKPRFDMDRAGRRRVMAWIDLNVPYYHTSLSNHYQRKGCRHMMPEELDAVLETVAARRCASCHAGGIPRTFYTRILEPENNNFLLAPLARAAGGTEACGKPIFLSKDDPDYRAILATFEPIHALLRDRPRMDMTEAACPCR